MFSGILKTLGSVTQQLRVVAMQCKLCGSASTEVLYDGPVRSGGVESDVAQGFVVLKCRGCGVAFMDPDPQEDDSYYAGIQYWASRYGDDDEKLNVSMMRKKLGSEQIRWLTEIGMDAIEGRVVADVGCGLGFFLDLVRNIAKRTVGVDPGEHLAGPLVANGHEHYVRVMDLEDSSLDVVVSFDTLEHLRSPIDMLTAAGAKIRDGGEIYVGVPNNNDFLKKVMPPYNAFFYHTSHRFYFDPMSLEYAMTEAGYEVAGMVGVHKYNIMNMIKWARFEEATGRSVWSVFDRTTEESFRSQIERQLISSHILVRAKKAGARR